MTTINLVKPFSSAPLVNFAEELLRGQVGWWLANEGAGGKLYNIVNRNRATGILQSGASWTNGRHGRAIAVDGTANGFVELGGAEGNLLAANDPFTLSWHELVTTPGAAGTFLGSATLGRGGSTERWVLMRTEGSGAYATVTVGVTAVNTPRWLNAPSQASGVGIWRQWIIRMSAAIGSNTVSGYNLWVDGTDYGAPALGPGNTTPSGQTLNVTRVGYAASYAANCFAGAFSSIRLWNRALSDREIAQLISRPYAGAESRRLIFGATRAAGNQGNMFLAM